MPARLAPSRPAVAGAGVDGVGRGGVAPRRAGGGGDRVWSRSCWAAWSGSFVGPARVERCRPRHGRGGAAAARDGGDRAGPARPGAAARVCARSGPVVDLAQQGASVTLRAEVTSDPRLLPATGTRRTALVIVDAAGRVRSSGAAASRTSTRPCWLSRPRAGWRLQWGEEVEVRGRLGPPRPGDDVVATLTGKGPPVTRAPPSLVQRAAGSAAQRAPRARWAARRAMVPGCCPAWSSATPSGLDPGLEQAMRSSGLTHLVAVSGSNVAIVCRRGPLPGPATRAAAPVPPAAGCAHAGRLRDRGAARAQRPASRGDGWGRSRRPGHRSGSTGSPGPVGRDHRAARRRPVAGPVLRFRPVGSGDARAAALRPSVGRGPVEVVATAVGHGHRRSAGGPSRMRSGDCPAARVRLVGLGPGQPGRRSVGCAGDDRRGPRSGCVPGLRRAWPTSSAWCGVLPAEGIAAVARLAQRAPAAPVAGRGGRRGLTCPAHRHGRPRRGAGRAGVRPTSLGARRRSRPCSSPASWPTSSPGWPPPGWVMVMCDVGQGDGLVLDTAPHHAIVVDTGPDPALMDACLRRLADHRGRPAGPDSRPRRPRRGRARCAARSAGRGAADERAGRPASRSGSGRSVGCGSATWSCGRPTSATSGRSVACSGRCSGRST